MGDVMAVACSRRRLCRLGIARRLDRCLTRQALQLLKAMGYVPVSSHQTYLLIAAADMHNERLPECYVGAKTTRSWVILGASSWSGEVTASQIFGILFPNISRNVYTSGIELGKWLSLPAADHAWLAPSVDRANGYPDQ